MRAILFDGKATRLVDDIEVRTPGPGEVRVRIVASGLCQSDLSVMSGKIPFPVPVVLGHEGAGVVEEVGPGVVSPAVGDHVVLTTLATCGHCRACVGGSPTMCRESFGRSATPFSRGKGGVHSFASLSTFGDQLVARAGQAVPIPDDIPLTAASLIGCCVLTGAGAVFNRARVAAGDSVVVIGAGGVGLNVVQAARISGATTIIAVDTNPDKEEKARHFGATHFVDPRSEDSVAAVHRITGAGVNHAFDCVGGESIATQAVSMLAWQGQLTLLGVGGPESKLSVPAMDLYMDKSILGCRYGSARPADDIARYVELYRSGRLLLDELVTATYPLEDFETLVRHAREGRLDRGVLTIGS